MKLFVGFITYNDQTAKYLPFFLPSLKNQTEENIQIIAFDNSENKDNANLKYIKDNFPDIRIIRSEKNVGFAKAYNKMIELAEIEGAEYFLALNPDMVIEPDMIEKLVLEIEKDEKIGAIAPKILKWDFENNKKTNTIDSCGITLNKENRFSDAHQGEIDSLENSDKSKEEIFGFTGATVLFRIKALRDVVFGENDYFDSLMFMYKEDADLSYRLRLAGWKIILEKSAIAYHNRTASPKGESNLKIALNRKNKSKKVKQWSFLNHWIIISKYRKLPFSLSVKIKTAFYQFKSLVFTILFERYLLKELLTLWRIRNDIKKRREGLKVRVDVREIENFMK